MSGLLVAIEGGDAVGKATQSRLLASRLGGEVVSFPRYDTPVGRIIKLMLREELAPHMVLPSLSLAEAGKIILQVLMTADKLDGSVGILEALGRGEHRVLDRWWPSALVYGSADGLDQLWLRRLGSMLPRPQLSILVDVPRDVAVARRPVPEDRYEADVSLRGAVRARYLDLWEAMSVLETGWVVVSGEGSVEEVAEKIWSHVSPLVDGRRFLP